MPRRKYPSYDEFQGPFNVSKANLRGMQGAGADTPYCTMARLPRWTVAEFWRIRDDLNEYLARPGRLGKKAGRLVALGEPTEDRTLDAYVKDVNLLTKGFFTTLQGFLRDKWPLWRVLIVDEPGDEIAVYPQAVRLVRDLGSGSFESRLARLRQRVARKRKRREGLLPRQIAHLAVAFKQTLKNESQIPECAVLAVFDNLKGDPAYDTFCILHRGYANHGIDWPDWEGLGPYRWVDNEFVELANEGTEWYVTFAGIPKGARGPLVVVWGYGQNKQELKLGAIERIRAKKMVDV